MTHKERFDDLAVPSSGSLALNSNVDTSDIDLSITPDWTGQHNFTSGASFDNGGIINRDTTGDSTYSGITLRDWGSVNVILDRDNNDGFNRSFTVWQDGDDVSSANPVMRANGFALTLEAAQPLEWPTNSGVVDEAINLPVDGTPTAGTEQSYTFAISSQNITKHYAEADGAGGVQNEDLRMFAPFNTNGNDIEDAGTVVWDSANAWVPQEQLENDSLTVTAGDGLKNGGSVALGATTTIDVEPADFAGNALEDDGSDNLAVSTDSIQTDELDLSISPTWTSGHTFTGSITAQKDGNDMMVFDRTANSNIENVFRLFIQDGTDDALEIHNDTTATKLFDIDGTGAIEVPSGSVNVTGGSFEVNDTQVVTSQQSAVASLTDNTGGTSDGTLAAVSGTGDDATVNNNLAELNGKVDAILSALRSHGLIAT